MKKQALINTLLGLDLFHNEIKSSIILHIPHSAVNIPDTEGYYVNLIEREIDLLTDHATDELFDVPGVDKIVFPFSRIYCDVERLDDDSEPMYEKGRGFYYTKTDDGQELRNEDGKEFVYNHIYKPYHECFTKMVEEKLEAYGMAIIIDCHSFPDKPLSTDLDQANDRPEICIGTDAYHTPDHLREQLWNHFKNKGYSIALNKPYSGTIVPLKFYEKDKRVSSIMIEVNRKLYLG